jgi:hypothetical protein
LPVIWVDKLQAMGRRHNSCCRQHLIGRSDRYHCLCCSIGVPPEQSQVLRLLLLILHGHRGRSGGGSHQTALTPIHVTTAKHTCYIPPFMYIRVSKSYPFTSNSAPTLRLARTSGYVSRILSLGCCRAGGGRGVPWRGVGGTAG